MHRSRWFACTCTRTYVVRANIRAKTEERETEGKSSSCTVRADAQGVRLHVHGGVRALVSMLSADIPRDRPRARVRGHDIIIAEPNVFPPTCAGNAQKVVPERKDQTTWAIYV